MMGATLPASSRGHTFLRSASAITPFSATERGRRVEPVSVCRFIMSGSRLISAVLALQERDLHQPPLQGEDLEVAQDVVAADHVEDHVDAAPSGCLGHVLRRKSSVAIVDRDLGAEPSAGRALLGAAGGGEHARAERLGQLDRRGADAAGAAMDQEALARTSADRDRTRWSTR